MKSIEQLLDNRRSRDITSIIFFIIFCFSTILFLGYYKLNILPGSKLFKHLVNAAVFLSGFAVVGNLGFSYMSERIIKNRDIAFAGAVALLWLFASLYFSHSFGDLGFYYDAMSKNNGEIYNDTLFIYPPIFYYLFKFISLFDFNVLGWFFSLLKIALLFCTIKLFIRDSKKLLAAFILLLSSIPVVCDLVAGNIEIPLSAAVLYYTVQSNRKGFGMFLSAMFFSFFVLLKPYLFMFSLILWVLTKNHKQFSVTISLMLAASLIQFFVNPDLYIEYISVIIWKAKTEVIPSFIRVNYLLAVGLGILIVHKIDSNKLLLDFENTFLLSSLLFVILSPRLNHYSYIFFLISFLFYINRYKFSRFLSLVLLSTSSLGFGSLYLYPSVFVWYSFEVSLLIMALVLYLALLNKFDQNFNFLLIAKN